MSMIQNPQTHDIVLWGQGEMHLRVRTRAVQGRFGRHVKSQAPANRAIRSNPQDRHQRGGTKSPRHGQFGDVVLESKQPRGSLEFHERCRARCRATI